jgi:hypothetical protein
VEVYYDELKAGADGQEKLINIVLLAKVQGLAKTKIGSAAAVTFAELKSVLYERCGRVETL